MMWRGKISSLTEVGDMKAFACGQRCGVDDLRGLGFGREYPLDFLRALAAILNRVFKGSQWFLTREAADAGAVLLWQTLFNSEVGFYKLVVEVEVPGVENTKSGGVGYGSPHGE